MPRPLRIALVLVGLAAVAYGAPGVTGGWLGKPSWWGEHERLPGEMIPTMEGRAISGAIILTGLALVAAAVWHRKPLRAALGAVGVSMALYGLACETGGWMGAPPWAHFVPAVPTLSLDRPERRTGITEAFTCVGLALVAIGAWPRRRRPAPGP